MSPDEARARLIQLQVQREALRADVNVQLIELRTRQQRLVTVEDRIRALTEQIQGQQALPL